MTRPERRWSTFGDVGDDWPPNDLTVEILAWNPDEALARVDTVLVRVRQRRGFARWRCAHCGVSIGWARCEHARAFAATAVPEPHPPAQSPAPTTARTH